MHHIFSQPLPYLFLPELDGELEPVQVHPVPVLERRSRGVVIQEHLQLVRAPRVVQKSGGEVLTLLPQLLILALELVLHQTQPANTPVSVTGSQRMKILTDATPTTARTPSGWGPWTRALSARATPEPGTRLSDSWSA
jgi:hypothetical protein